MTVELNENERELVLEILDGRLGELREEVYHATVSHYKDVLRVKEDVLRGIIAKIRGPQET